MAQKEQARNEDNGEKEVVVTAEVDEDEEKEEEEDSSGIDESIFLEAIICFRSKPFVRISKSM